MGFDLRIAGSQLVAFARFADQTGHRGPLTVALTRRRSKQTPRCAALCGATPARATRSF
jgi:hypothetical protein